MEIDLALVEELTQARDRGARRQARAALWRTARRPRRTCPAGCSSSGRCWPPHPIYVSRGEGSHVWDIDDNEYVDYHNGYGVMVMGHAHPKIVEAVQRARGARHALRPADRGRAGLVAENLAERFGLPYWRFGNSGTESTLDACRIMRALTGRKMILKIEGTYHGHHDSLMVSVFPPPRTRRARASTRRRCPRPSGMPDGVRRTGGRVPFNDAEAVERAFRGASGRDRRDDRRARDDELRRRPARPRVPRRR